MVANHFSEIYGTLAEFCPPLELEEKFGHIPADPDARRCPGDPAAAWSALAARHTVADLLAAGVAEEQRGGAGLASVLRDPQGSLLLLRDPEGGAVNDLLTARGCLRQRRLPIFAMLDDQKTQRRLQNGETSALCVCASLEDAILLRSLGFPAATAFGLERLEMDGIEMLGRAFGVGAARDEESSECESADHWEEAEQTAREKREEAILAALARDEAREAAREAYARRACSVSESDADGKAGDFWLADDGEHEEDEEGLRDLTLLLAAWSPRRLEPGCDPAIQSLEKYLIRLSRDFDLALLLATWRPSQAERERLAFLVEHRATRRWLRRRLLESMSASSHHPLRATPAVALPPTDYAEAVARLVQESSQCESDGAAAAGMTILGTRLPGKGTPADNWGAVYSLLYRDVIAPLFEEASRDADSIDRALRLTFANVSWLSHSQALPLAVKIRDLFAKGGVEALEQFPHEAFGQVISAAARLQGLAGELSKRKERRSRTALDGRALPSPAVARPIPLLLAPPEFPPAAPQTFYSTEDPHGDERS